VDAKRCSKCGEVKPLSEFHRGQGRGGVRADCKVCFRARRKALYDADPDLRREAADRVARWRVDNADYYRARREEYQKTEAYRRSLRQTHLKKKYGISLDEYERLLEAQDGGCAICYRPPRDDISLHVDHDHETGFIRGLLCFPCNNALGLMKDDPDRLRAALRYLDTPPAQAVLSRQR
jgi:hypothetical protein